MSIFAPESSQRPPLAPVPPTALFQTPLASRPSPVACRSHDRLLLIGLDSLATREASRVGNGERIFTYQYNVAHYKAKSPTRATALSAAGPDGAVALGEANVLFGPAVVCIEGLYQSKVLIAEETECVPEGSKCCTLKLPTVLECTVRKHP